MAARPWPTLAGIVATLGTALAIAPLVESTAWLGTAAIAVIAVAGTGAALRAMRIPAAVHPIAEILVLVEILTLAFAREVAAFGFLPGPVALEQLRDIARSGSEAAQFYAAPAPAEPGVALLVVAGIGAIAMAVDVIGVSLRLPALAGGALLALYAVPAAILRGGLDWWLLPIGAAGWLALLAADTADQARAWGPALRRPPVVAAARRAGPGAHPRAERSGLGLDAAPAALVSVAALVLAMAVPSAIPGLGEPVWGSGRGEAIGGTTPEDGSVSIDPFVSLRRNLIDNTGRELLRYTTDGPGGDYLRMVTLEEFDGVTWSSLQAPVQYPATEDLSVPLRATSGPIAYDIEVGPLDNPSLPIPFAAVSIEGTGAPLDSSWAWDPIARTVQGAGLSSEGLSYSVTAYSVEPTKAALRSATSDNNAELTALPIGLTGELGRLAAEVTAGERTPYDRAVAIERWLAQDGGFTYSTGVSNTPGADPLEEFLSDRIGYCEQFAATMALMARSVGIPARVVIGFTGGRQLDDGSWQVQARNAHAWPELWFDGIGWVWFEPTPRAEAGAGVTAPSYSDVPERSAPDDAAAPDDAPAPTPLDDDADGTGSATRSPWPWIALAAAIVIVLAALRARWAITRVRRTVRTGTADPRRRIEGAWAEIGAIARAAGLPWAAAASPRSAEATLQAALDPDGPARAALERLRWWIEQVRYAPPGSTVIAPAPGEVRSDIACIERGLRGGPAIQGEQARVRRVPARADGASGPRDGS